MNKLFLNKNYIFYTILAVFSFYINFYVGSNGVFPLDTFIHYDNGYRILLGEHPVKDYWIVHGFLIDYIQAFFFKFFGNEWKSYLYHSSIFNSCIVLFCFYVFQALNLNIKISLLLSISLSILAYPVSGTPFLDLHSSYFSLFSIFFGIIAIKKNKTFLWFWSSFFLCVAFFSKQVPAGYTIIFTTLIVLYLSIKTNKIFILLYFAGGFLFFLILLLMFLTLNSINVYDFILQIFLFPSSIGSNRYETYSLGFKNIFLDYKFIYLIFFIIIFLNLKKNLKNKDLNKDNFHIFLLITAIVFSSIFHQIYTKNQIYIFFLIPICSGFAIYFNNLKRENLKKCLNIFIIILCILTTFKYHERFNVKRKFHELQHTSIENTLEASKIHKKFSGLNWISPHYENPEEEIFYISNLIEVLLKEKKKVMLITHYNFFSSLTEKKLFTPSRTFDFISYPRKNTKYYKYYKKQLINLLKKNKIQKILIFKSHLDYDLDHLIFNYVKTECFSKKYLNENLLLLNVETCEVLK